MAIYGLETLELKEKELVLAINSALDSFFKANSDYNIYKSNKLSKRRNDGGLPSLDPEVKIFVYDYSYDYFNKSFGIYIQLHSNTNSYGEVAFDNEDIRWVLTFHAASFYVEEDLTVVDTKNPMIPMLVEAVLAGIPCKTALLEAEHE